MQEITRQRLVWTALVTCLAFLVASLLLAAFGAVTAGWYALGAVAYGAAFAIAIVAWRARPEAPAWHPQAVPTPPAAPARGSELRERVIYTTPHGDVVERDERGPSRAAHGFIVERDAGAAHAADVERALDRAAAKLAREPTIGELNTALRRWGRVHEGGS